MNVMNGQLFRFLIILGCLSILFFGCNLKKSLPVTAQDVACHKVKIADGPEDFVLDQWHGAPRLLVSSHDRRHPETSGGIYYFDLETENTGELLRTGEPETIAAYKPHGMDIRRDGNKTLLYVIIHDPYAHMKRDENAVVVYEVYDDAILFLALLEDLEHLWSPNDLSVMPSGEIYLTNDRRGDLDLYLRRKASEIVYYNPKNEKWTIVADDIAFANGILAEADRVFVNATLDDQVMVFPRREDGTLGARETIVRVKGPDNLMRYGKFLLTTAHFDDLAFLRHQKNPEEISPSIVFRIRPDVYTIKPLYVDKGGMISAASTAMIYNDKLYISQVFDPYIVVCDVPKYIY
jgi:arylesterase/paraoxonase